MLYSLTHVHKITYKYHITALVYLLANAANELQCYCNGKQTPRKPGKVFQYIVLLSK